MSHMAYRKDIDGLRSIAVLSVVLFHSGVTVLSGGFVGVDIFFVISGYLISAGLFKESAGGQISIARFYERRIRRIVPAYTAVVLVTLLAGALVLLPSDYTDLGRSALSASLFIANIFFWNGAGYFAGLPISHPLLHMWSLAVEEQFYLVWPLVLALLYRFRGERWLIHLIVMTSVITLAASEWMLGYSAKTAFYMAPLRAWELLLGAFVATGKLPRLRSAGAAHAIGAIALALLIIPMFVLSETSRFPGLAALPSCLGAALILYRDERYPSFAAGLLSMKGPVFVGLISYSLYLWHWPILSLTWYATNGAAGAPMTALLLVVMLVVSTLSWRFIERPFRNRPKPAGDAPIGPAAVTPTRTILLAGGGTLALIAALSGVTVLFHGFPSRIPAEAALVDAARRTPYRSRHGCVLQDDIPAQVGAKCFGEADRMSGRKIFLWGDSYAAMHVKTVEDALDRPDRPVVAIIATGCTPLPGTIQYFGRGRADDRCNRFNEEVFRRIAGRSDVERVIIAGRWSNLYGLEVPGETFDPSARFLTDVRGRDKTLDTSLGVMARSLERLVEPFSGRNVPVTFLLEPPRYVTNERACVARALWRRASLDECAVGEAEQKRFRARVLAIFAKLAARHGDVEVIDPLPGLCSGGVCRGFVDGTLLTEDTGHLTGAGSRQALGDWLKRMSDHK